MTYLSRCLLTLLVWTSASLSAGYRNPVLFADYSDPDAVRDGDDYYLVSSSFDCVPGLPVLHSRDLIHWTILSYAVPRLPAVFDGPQHGNGLWAPSLRRHDGWFWIYVGDPDRGIFLTRARDPRGPWEPLTLVKEAKGWIDPCPLWDDDGSMYLVHAWAKSRAGFNSVLTVNRMSADGRHVVDDGTVVFDGREHHPTIEGPKFYKRNGWYYIFAPAGGVKDGWQTVLRAKNVFGPYEDKVVLEHGLHQGAWVDDARGRSWFLHFQDRGAYGRVVSLEPMTWLNEWPEIAACVECGEREAASGGREMETPRAALDPAPLDPPRSPLAASPSHLQTSDEFDGPELGLQWQWQGNPAPGAYELRHGNLRLSPVPANLWNATNLLLQKFPAPAFAATTRIEPGSLKPGQRAGLVVMGADYATLVVEKTAAGVTVKRITARDADREGKETELARAALPEKRETNANLRKTQHSGLSSEDAALCTRRSELGTLLLRVTVTGEAVCRFSYSTGGATFLPLGPPFVASPGRWIGAKVGLFGAATFDWFHVEELHPSEIASLVVAQDGSGDFRTIQEAVDAIPAGNSQHRLILIRNGLYHEKVSVTQSHLSLVGEDRDMTRIEYAELRRNWRVSHPDDWGAAVVNIGAEAKDVVLANLTVHNTYGGEHGGGEHDHQFAVRSMEHANRIAILHANIVADGGDTLSLWNHETGLTYYDDSYFEGWVDFVCPRAWAYATNCRFYGHDRNASIWHDGSKDEEQKFVIRHSRFDGDAGFALGRHHRDAQLYVLDSTFSAQMADKPIAAVPAPDPVLWGERIYYANDHRDGADFPWFADNLAAAAGAPREEDVDAVWTFGGRWDPSSLPPVLPFASMPQPENGAHLVDWGRGVVKWKAGRNATAQRLYFDTVNPPQLRAELHGTEHRAALAPATTYYWRADTVTADGIVTGPVWTFRTDDRPVRIALAGDSTVTEKQGWGNGFKARLTEGAALINAARGGRSSKSYAAEGHWGKLLREERPTHVLIQFGHNDVPGKGLDRETDLPTFKANMARYVEEARAAGAVPVLVTPLTRRYFGDDAHVHSDLSEYAKATREVAAQMHAPLIDLHTDSIELLDGLGPAVGLAMSPLKTDGTIDKTHLNATGSAFFGSVVADELRLAVPELAPYFRANRSPVPAPAWSARIAEAQIRRTPDPLLLDSDKPKWDYTQGLVLKAILELAERTGDARYWKYVEAYYNGMIDGDGTIHTYHPEELSLDRINAGKPLFALYEKTHKEKYRKAIETLRRQLREQPRNPDGGFWHKKRYPHQMWLDGLYMGAPFLAQYAKAFHEPAAFDDVINQFVLMEQHARDEKTGLLYHGWDESREQKWADPQTGRSPALWGRAMGWYAMGLVETLDFLPMDHPRRGELLAILGRLAEAFVRVQDPKTGAWWQVVDQPGRGDNYLEASVSTMFAFVLLKSSRLGYIDPKYAAAGQRAWRGLFTQFVDGDTIHHVCQVVGLGGDPEKERYRDGSFDYYVHEKIRDDDPKAVGPFIFAAMEVERR